MNSTNKQEIERGKKINCVICQIDNPNYKCPKCKVKYCSVNCYKSHKDNCVKHDDQAVNDIKTEERELNEDANLPLNLNEFQDIILDEKKLIVLKENKSIMTKLKNKKLQKIIKEIDSTKYKKRTLEKMMNDKDFKDFTDEILDTLGYLKDNIFTY